MKHLLLILMCIVGLQNSFASVSELSDDIVEIPYKTVRGVHVLPITINNEEYKFIFDTGAVVTTISQDVFQNSTYKVVDSVLVRDGDKRTKYLKRIAIPKLFIGNKEFLSTHAVLQPQFNYSEIFGCEKIDGILGYDIIKQMKWKIDNTTKKIYLSGNIDALLSQKEIHKIKFKEKNNTILINTRINGSKTILKLDTGFNKKISINKSLYAFLKEKKSNIQEAQFKGWTKTTFYGKKHGVYQLLRLDIFEIGDLSITEPIASHSTNSPSILGNEFFKNFIVILDPDKQNILLEKTEANSNDKDTVFQATLTPDYNTNTVIIKNIHTSSNLNALVKPENKILKIDEKNVSNFSRDELCHFWSIDWPGYLKNQAIKITVEDELGKEKEIELLKIKL